MKIGSVGAELFQSDRRTDTAKITVDFRNFANASRNTKRRSTTIQYHQTSPTVVRISCNSLDLEEVMPTSVLFMSDTGKGMYTVKDTEQDTKAPLRY
jgi:hypothetical protein